MALKTEDIYTELRAYVSGNFLEGAEIDELDRDTPLLEWGVLNSMNTAVLMAHIRDRFGVDIPPMYITGKRFRDLSSITEMVHELSLRAA
ncbi:acyl carrier protein [Spirillospora sp. CA-294931]|uniref:acyl carrier protein n=1 Tax=Spirillospora sp. CA-294931 TaxID=3240042 RepID=UPI003D8C5A2E